MTFPLYFVLYPYYAFLVIFGIMTLIDIFHLVRFSSVNFGSFLATFFFLGGTAYILFWTLTMLAPIDLHQIITLFQNVSLTPSTY